MKLSAAYGPSHRVCRTSPHHFGITRPRRYPIQQAQYSCVLPTLCQNGGHRKRVLSRGHSRVVCRPSTVRIAPPGSNLARFPMRLFCLPSNVGRGRKGQWRKRKTKHLLLVRRRKEGAMTAVGVAIQLLSPRWPPESLLLLCPSLGL
ncbi:Nuclear envelope pore membrane protein POM 121 [Manis javanica]|nr:Nuclear envelope pore membrane protein POM 121 [Manis javanica]